MDKQFIEAASEISAKLRAIEAEYRGAALGAFLVLEKFDPETTKLALETFSDRNHAAMWFSDHVGSLCGKTPWDYLAIGDVKRVRWVMNAINYGIPG